MWRASAIILLVACVAAAGAGPSVPVFFIANHGQAPSSVAFMAKGSGLTAYFLRREILLRAHGAWLHMRFAGASSTSSPEGSNLLPGRANFLTGPARQWHRDEPIFGAVRYRGLYPGIDMVYGGTGRQFKSEFLVAPGADPKRIRIRYAGAGKLTVQPDGSLSIPLQDQSLTEGIPYVYQERNGAVVTVSCRYLVSSGSTVGFDLGPYDRNLPLIIDPVLTYSSLMGGTGFNAATALAVDSTGAAYIAGYTDSYNLLTANPEQNFNAGGNEAFIAKLNPSGNGLQYCTYLGGSGDDRAYGIAVDATGAAYVTGSTNSQNFPTLNAAQSSLAGGRNAFLTKLNPAGDILVFSTYLGGGGTDIAYGIALDTLGDSYLVGDTTSMNFPAGGFQTSYHGSQDIFVAKISANGGHLLYSTYLGGSGTDHGAAIAVDSTGTAYVTGYTWSRDFPLANASQGSIGGGCDAFVARLSSNGNNLVFATYLGGSGGSVNEPEAGLGIAVDAQGDTYVAGVTSSTNFPLLNAVQPVLLGSTDAFITKMTPAGSLIYSTFMGGSGVDVANAIALDASGSAYVVGYTYSTDFPITVGAAQLTLGGESDAFIIKLSPTGNSLLYASYLGGHASDTASAVAVDPAGDIFIAGWTMSSNFPVVIGQ